MPIRTCAVSLLLIAAAVGIALAVHASQPALVVAVPVSDPPPADLESGPGSPSPSTRRGNERLVARIEAVSTPMTDDGFGASAPTGSGDIALPLETAGHVYVGLGAFDAEGDAVPGKTGMNCTGAVPDDRADDKRAWALDRAPELWWARVRFLPSEFGKLTLEIDWTHYRSVRRGDPSVVTRERRRVTLREGESHHLGFVDDPDARGPYRNVLIRITADVKEDPAFAHALLQYDLWWSHTDDRGRSTTRRFRAVGAQGEELSFRFEPMRRPAPELDLADGTAVEGILETLGAVRGRLRADGTIDVRFGATRWASAVVEGEPRLGGIGVGGRRVVTVAPGEAVGFRFPEHQGSSGLGRVGDDRTLVHGRFYAGHEDTLILTVSPADG